MAAILSRSQCVKSQTHVQLCKLHVAFNTNSFCDTLWNLSWQLFVEIINHWHQVVLYLCWLVIVSATLVELTSSDVWSPGKSKLYTGWSSFRFYFDAIRGRENTTREQTRKFDLQVVFMSVYLIANVVVWQRYYVKIRALDTYIH